MVIITKSGNKLKVKNEATALDMVDKNVGWKIEGENGTPTKPSRKKSEPTD